MSELWKRLRQARRDAEMTQLDLAKACGVSRGAVALWESSIPAHRTKPSTEHLVSVAKATGASLEQLLEAAGENAKQEYSTIRSNVEALAPPREPSGLPDLRQNRHLFCFAHTPEDLPAKIATLMAAPEDVQRHLVLVGMSMAIHTVPSASEGLSLVVRELTAQPA